MKTVEFYEAVRKGIIQEGDFIRPEELFQKEKTKILLGQEQTGWSEEQVFKREKLRWFFARDPEGNFTLFGSTTNNVLTLFGKTGYENGIEVQNTIINALYSNESIGVKSRAMTKEDTIMLRKKKSIKRILKYNVAFRRVAWLGSSFIASDGNRVKSGINYISHNGVNYCHLFRSNGHMSGGYFGLRPVLHILERQILVDADSMKREGCWSLLINK